MNDIVTYKLSDILDIVKKGFDEVFYGFNFWFESEISRAKTIKGERLYIDLIEFDKNGYSTAKGKGVIFDSTVWKKFLENIGVEKFEELNGYKFLFHGRVNFHKDYGFSIIIDDISTNYILGQFKKTKQDIIKNLQKEGIINKNINTTVSFPPFNIAIISSENSEGYKDFINILEHSGYKYYHKLYNSSVHGNQAKAEVYESLQQIYLDIKNGEQIDFVCIIRGGGGSSGILWQDDENIARGVCNIQVPVIVAVGHTNDRFVLDDVSKYSATTPSQAGYIITSIYDQYIEQINRLYENVYNSFNNKIKLFEKDIDFLIENINYLTSLKLKNIKENIEVYMENIKSFSPEKLINNGYALLVDKEGNYITKEQIQNMDQGEYLYIKIYDKILKVQLKSIDINQ